MAVLDQFVAYYAFVFHPITVLGAGILALIYEEWADQGLDRSALARRAAAFLGAGVLALVPTAAYFLLRGGLQTALEGSSWRMDLLVAGGVFVAAGVTWYLWRRFEWGAVVPDGMVTLVAATVPYAVLSPFWDVSGHVLLALAPLLYLALVDAKYWPLVAVPLFMVPNRVAVNAHTVEQAIAGFLVATVVTLHLYYRGGERRSRRPSPTSTP